MMHRKVSLALVVVAVMAVMAVCSPAVAGGWAVVTLDRLPQQVIAGRAFTVGFVVRQHGQRPAGGLAMTVVFDRVGDTAIRRFDANESRPAGHYTATIRLPEAGVWRWRVEGFGEHAMPGLVVQSTATRAQRTVPARLISTQRVTLGQDLFVAKGCASCHAHSAIAGSGRFSGAHGAEGSPDLTQRKLGPSYLHMWLRDPKAVKPTTNMPNLGLTQPEIEALTAFLTQ